MDRLLVQRYLVDEKKMYDDVADELCDLHSEVIATSRTIKAAAEQILDSEKSRLGSNSLPLSYFNPDA